MSDIYAENHQNDPNPTAEQNLLMQAENMLAAWDRMYRLINPRDNFPKVFADLTEDMEFRELQWLRRAVAEAKPALTAEPKDGTP